MKRILALLLMLLCLIPGGCASKEKTQEDKMIREAIEVLKESYKTFYGNRERVKEGYLEINDTKVFYIKDNFRLSDEDDQEMAENLFGDAKCIVCFSLYSDNGTAPYYPAGGMFDAVMVYEDGSMEAGPNPFYNYMYIRHKDSLLKVISSVSDRDSDFNKTWRLLK